LGTEIFEAMPGNPWGNIKAPARPGSNPDGRLRRISLKKVEARRIAVRFGDDITD
jgi:hypothetical protein